MVVDVAGSWLNTHRTPRRLGVRLLLALLEELHYKDQGSLPLVIPTHLVVTRYSPLTKDSFIARCKERIQLKIYCAPQRLLPLPPP